jgi:hypothetical protein
VCGVVEEEDKSNKQKLERDEKKEQHEEQLEEVSLLQSSPCKPTMVVEICRYCHELSIATKVCCFHQDFLSLVYFFKNCFYLFLLFLFSFSFFSCFFVGFCNAVFWHFNFKKKIYLSFFFLLFKKYFIISNF